MQNRNLALTDTLVLHKMLYLSKWTCQPLLLRFWPKFREIVTHWEILPMVAWEKINAENFSVKLLINSIVKMSLGMKYSLLIAKPNTPFLSVMKSPIWLTIFFHQIKKRHFFNWHFIVSTRLYWCIFRARRKLFFWIFLNMYSVWLLVLPILREIFRSTHLLWNGWIWPTYQTQFLMKAYDIYYLVPCSNLSVVKGMKCMV